MIKKRAKANRRTIAGELEWILIESKVVKPLEEAAQSWRGSTV
ncbi:MAG: hypothetical protein QXW32_07110 [Nitrososphaerales archaeon]